MVSYTHREADEISYNFRIVMSGLKALHPRFLNEAERSLAMVSPCVGDPTYARVIVAGELLRGINRDQSAPVVSGNVLMTIEMQQGLRLARDVGRAIAPFAVRNMRQFLRRYFSGSPPVLDQGPRKLCSAVRCFTPRRCINLLSVDPQEMAAKFFTRSVPSLRPKL